MPRLQDFETFAICISLDIVAGTAAGYSLGRYEYFINHDDVSIKPKGDSEIITAGAPWILLEFAGFLATFLVLRNAGVALGDPDMGPRRWRYHLLVFFWLMLCEGYVACWYSMNLKFAFANDYNGQDDILEFLSATYYIFTYPAWACIWVSMLIGVRGIALLVSSVIGLLASTAIFFAMTLKLKYLWYPGFFIKISMLILCCSCTRYLHHQRMAACIASQPILAYLIGYGWADYQSKICTDYCPYPRIILPLCFEIIVVYSNFMLRRSQRFLPPGLSEAKFVRMGYLRHLMDTGGRLCRCQDLPDEAFGDVGVAQYLLIVSHRWLHPYTCDIIVDGFPQGFKLHHLYSRLAKHFAVSRLHLASCQNCLNALCIGGWDVVIFFDFLSVPQRKQQADGLIIERTPAEQEVFISCLPNMGTLYSTFEVLVLDEVPDNDAEHNYIESGWCSCEWGIAMFGNTLPRYSAEQLQRYASNAGKHAVVRTMSDRTSRFLEDEIIRQIESKPFLLQSDRDVAIDIVHAFAKRRLITDAIKRRDIASLRSHLSDLKDKRLLASLHEPVDGSLNTNLHVAAQANFALAVSELLRFGANPKLRNRIGDTPYQMWLFPRFSSAAKVCRRAKVPLVAEVVDAEIVGNPGCNTPEVSVASRTQSLSSLQAVTRAVTPAVIGTGDLLSSESSAL